ncbi:hypothetical protein JCGZ_02420 [Jatropha curcas]|uniref:Uncharacterized protein n=1 Tax=Jatropha curcas TaxID=180498 RepID=A0A067LQV2_JATCU|nr:hypothetical protein JCGZ_02420 [Jatropha curcas]
MARGRAFDSDAFGSGSRGGRGPGRSARGRGGAIPHPSSGTSGASSSAQCPVLPPSQPSTPSSSTGVFGPVQTPPAAQSPTVPASSDPRITLSLVAGYIYPSSRAARQILRIIKLQLHKEGYIWDAVPQEARDFYWEEFQAITAMLKVAYEKICTDRYADFTYRMRRSGKKHQCVSQEIWESWQKAWEDPAFKRKREIFAQNRRSETGGDGAGPSRHTGESISTIETARLLENYTTARERIVTSQTDESEAESRIDEVALYLQVVGGKKKRRYKASGLRHHSFITAQQLTLLQPAQNHSPSTLTSSILIYGLSLLISRDRLQSLERM